MYSSVGQQDSTVEQLPGQTMWNNEFDADYSPYIDHSVMQEVEDLPRATSAPPHLQDRLRAASADILSRSGRMQDMYTDIRYDDDYNAFYEMHSRTDNLPPPIDRNTLYTDMQNYFSQSQQQQQYKDNSMMPGQLTRLGSGNQNPYGLRTFNSQASLSRAGLETVEEQPSVKKEQKDDSIIEALNQFNIGNEIQRPGSQPAPYFFPGLPSDVGHYRSASALASVNLDGISNITGPGSAPTSSPAPSQSPSLNHSMLQQAPGNDYLSYVQQPQQSGSPLAGTLEYQAAYQAALQAALIQSQNSSQMMLPSQMSNSQTNHNPGNSTPTAGLNMSSSSSYGSGMQGHGAGNDMSLLAAKMQQGPGHNFYSQTTSQANPNVGASGSVFPPHQSKEGGYGKEDHSNVRGKRYGRREIRERESGAFGGNSCNGVGNGTGSNEPYYDSQYIKLNSIEEVVGQVIHVAQDQNGCRFLQRKFDEGGAQSISKVFPEILENIVHLMKDPFGNYLIQKLLDRCSESQRTEVVKAVAEGGELISIALSTHGTRAVQKLIETLTSKEQRQLAIAALEPGVVQLIKDLNGNHVIQRCLQRLGPEDSQFIYDAAIGYCVDIASHRHGCCVLQRCIDFANPEQRMNMIMEISSNALVLSQDAFGNYVVQYVLDLGQPEASQRIMTVLTGNYSDLAVQKFSSNVVEKCLKLGGLDDARESIIKEIMHSPSLPRLLQDPYGNYVVQSALTVTSGSLHQNLVECIRPYLPSLRGTPHGKRILQKVLASLKDPF